MNESITPVYAPGEAARAMSPPERLLRRQTMARLASLQHGRLVIEDAGGRVVLGERVAQDPQPDVCVTVRDPAFYRLLAANGSVGAGEAYADGHWSCNDLVGLVRLLVRNRDLLDGMETGMARLGGWGGRPSHLLYPNLAGGGRREHSPRAG